ncbi:MAG: M20 family metallopeptidase [Anaerolineales bacterium]|nr:M20 family metallopeptidase [Anaerolineales bacterium]
MTNISDLKQRAIKNVDAARDELIQLSSTIHANPELAFKEFKSSALLCDALEKHGLKVERGIGGLETAFRAEARGSRSCATIAILAEYDALPELGHACGHNIIGTAAIGAGIALKPLMSEIPGRVLVIGTPAEEGGGGKVILLKNRAFESVDAAMMVHPAARTMVTRGSLATQRVTLEFFGKASHAASSPEDGISALEALLAAFHNINAMRLHLRADARVHGIITHGGAAINIIPEYAAAKFSIRAATRAYVAEIMQRVIQCAQAGAVATGAQFKHSIDDGYLEIIPNRALARAFAENWRALGVEVHEPRPNERMGSTDMGDVSHALPALHPYIAIVPDGTPGHSVEMRAASNAPVGHTGLLNAAKGLALTAIDLLCDENLMQETQREFAAAK